MTTDADMAEFMERTGSALVKEALGDTQEAMPTTQARNRLKNEAVISAGVPTQWGLAENGYIPCTETAPRLAPGAYSLSFRDIGLHLERRTITTDSLLRLPDSKSDSVIGEIERFWTLKERFTRFGFVHKRGFLLWGPPGSGKTSTVAFVTQQMVKDGGVVFIGTIPGPLAAGMAVLRQIEPERRLVVVLEDIDALLRKYGEAEFLSLLDGEASIDNVVFLATTNYPENLDGRVLNRPSRFDRVVKIDTPNKEARCVYLLSRGVEGDLAPWIELSEGFSIAHLKELIVCVCCFGEKLEEVAKRLRGMAKRPSSEQGGAVGFGAG